MDVAVWSVIVQSCIQYASQRSLYARLSAYHRCGWSRGCVIHRSVPGLGGGSSLHNELYAHAPAGLALARVELLIQPSAMYAEILAAFIAGGWSCESIALADLERVERENWNLVVLGSETVTPVMLAAAARASRNPRTRVLAVARTRDPQPIADILDAGADDYLSFPFEPAELRARAQSLIAFSFSLPARRRLGAIGFDFAARTIFDGNARVVLSPSEWDILIALLDADGEPVTLSILSKVAGHTSGHPGSVASTISRLRRKLRAGAVTGLDIDTIGGKGYVLHYRERFPSR